MPKIRFNILLAVFKKEMLDIQRDKRTLAIMILLPLILYPLLLLATSQVTMMLMKSREDKVYSVAFDFAMDTRLENLITEKGQDYKLVITDPENPAESLDMQEIMAYVTLEDEGGKAVYQIHYKSSQGDSDAASGRIKNILEDYKQLLTKNYLVNAGLDPEIVMEPISYNYVDLSAGEEVTGMFLGSILPFLLIIALVTGAMYPAIDVTSGEKERGTLETLLTLPISSLELMGGKFMAVSLVAVVSAVLNFLSLTLVGVFLLNNIASQAFNGEKALVFNISSMFLPFLLILLCIIIFAFLVSAVVLCITSLAKSFKEANNYMTPVIMIFMFPALVTMIPEVSLTAKTAALPVVNISLLIRDALTMDYNALNIAIVMISNIGYALVAVTFLSRIYNSENILFGTRGELNLLERRSHIIPGSKINPGDGLIIYLVGFLLLFYLSSVFMEKLGFFALAANEAVILGLTILAAVYLKADLKQTFKLRLPALKDIAGGLVLWLGAFILANLAAELLLELFPQNEEVVSQLAKILRGDTLWITLLIVALLPAVCEELLFRGLIFSSLQGSVKTSLAIFLTGFMFALYHMDFIRLAPTLILGILFTLALYRTGSILIPITMHFINNSTGVVFLFYPDTAEKLNLAALLTGNPVLQTVIYLLLSILLITAGVRILKTKRNQNLWEETI